MSLSICAWINWRHKIYSLPFFKNLSSFNIATALTSNKAASNNVPKVNTMLPAQNQLPQVWPMTSRCTLTLQKVSAKSENRRMESGSNSPVSHPEEGEPAQSIMLEGTDSPQGESVKMLLALLRQHQEALNKWARPCTCTYRLVHLQWKGHRSLHYVNFCAFKWLWGYLQLGIHLFTMYTKIHDDNSTDYFTPCTCEWGN